MRLFPQNGKRHYTVPEIYHTMQGWMFPYFRSRTGAWRVPSHHRLSLQRVEVQPGLQLLLGLRQSSQGDDRGHCQPIDRLAAFDNMPRSRAHGRRSTSAPEFAHKVIYYAAKQGFWVYLPTNGRLMKPDVIDRVADAGVATVNLAVDAWDLKPGLPKAMAPIRQYFKHLVRKQYKYGYRCF